MRWLGTVLLFGAMACGSSLGGSNDSGGGGAGGKGGTGGIRAIPVPCEQAVDGDPCGPNYQQCGPLDGYGCSKHCIAGTGVWSVTCIEPPTCATYTNFTQAVPCASGVVLDCGPFEVDSLCGKVSATATCTYVGWAYDLPCDPDCESLGQADCGKYTGCAWAVPCDNPNLPHVAPRCIDFPPHFGFCDPDICPTGTTCVNASVNTNNFSSGDCTNSGVGIALCIPQ